MPIWNLPDWILFAARTGLNPLKLPISPTPVGLSTFRQTEHSLAGKAPMILGPQAAQTLTETELQASDSHAPESQRVNRGNHSAGMSIQPLACGLLLSLSLSLCALPGHADPPWHLAPKIPPREYAPIAPIPRGAATTPETMPLKGIAPEAGMHPVSNTAPFAGYNQEQAATWHSAASAQSNASKSGSPKHEKRSNKEHPVVVAPIPLLPETPPPDDWVRPTGNSSQAVPLPGSEPLSTADNAMDWQAQASIPDDSANNSIAAVDAEDAASSDDPTAPAHLYYYPRVAPAHMPDSESDRPTNILTLAPNPTVETTDNAVQMLTQDEAQMAVSNEAIGTDNKDRDPAFALLDKFFGPTATANSGGNNAKTKQFSNTNSKTAAVPGSPLELKRIYSNTGALPGHSPAKDLPPEPELSEQGNVWKHIVADTSHASGLRLSETPDTPIGMANLADEGGTSISFKAYSKDPRKREIQLQKNAAFHAQMYGEMTDSERMSSQMPSSSSSRIEATGTPGNTATKTAQTRPVSGKNKPLVSFPEPLTGGNSSEMTSGRMVPPGGETAATWDQAATDEAPIAHTGQTRSTMKTTPSEATEPGMVPVSWSSPRVSTADALRHYNRAAYYGQQDQIDEAIAEYKDAILSNAGFADAYVGLSTAYMRKNDWENVIRQAEKGMQLKEGMMDPANIAQAQYNLGAAYCAADDFEKAKLYYETLQDSAAPNARQLWDFMVRTCKP